MVLVLCPSVLVLALVLNLVVSLTSLQDANLDRRRGELTRSAHPDAPHLARRGEPTPNTPSVFYLNFTGHLLEWVFPLGVLSALYTYHVSAFVLLLFNMDSKLID